MKSCDRPMEGGDGLVKQLRDLGVTVYSGKKPLIRKPRVIEGEAVGLVRCGRDC